MDGLATQFERRRADVVQINPLNVVEFVKNAWQDDAAGRFHFMA